MLNLIKLFENICPLKIPVLANTNNQELESANEKNTRKEKYMNTALCCQPKLLAYLKLQIMPQGRRLAKSATQQAPRLYSQHDGRHFHRPSYPKH